MSAAETEPTRADVLRAIVALDAWLARLVETLRTERPKPMTVHAASIDYSPDTGSLVVCTCGLVLGPFHEYGEAKKAAAEHRRWTGAEVIGSEDRRREVRRLQNTAARRRRVAEARGRGLT